MFPPLSTGSPAPSALPRKCGTRPPAACTRRCDAHYERARAAGAEIVHPPRDESYGRTYTVRDIDGHPWFFTRPPAER
jgi:uncharacterized glyoxalase superfamily protein PhnB